MDVISFLRCIMKKVLTDVEMKGSSEFILKNLATELSCKIGEIFQSYKKGLVSKDSKFIWKGYYKGQMTLWFSKCWPDFKSSCSTLMKHYPHSEAIRNIANVKITAMTSDKDRWTKGDAFKEVFANLEQALIDCGKEEVAKELFNKFNLMLQFIEENEDDAGSTNTSIYSGTSKVPKKIARTSANIELQINMQLFKLPKHLYQQAREYTFKDSNLERNLQQFKQEHNLT